MSSISVETYKSWSRVGRSRDGTFIEATLPECKDRAVEASVTAAGLGAPFSTPDYKIGTLKIEKRRSNPGTPTSETFLRAV